MMTKKTTLLLWFTCALLQANAARSFAQETAARHAHTVLGDTTMPSAEDRSQRFPYGITGKTPPSLIKSDFEGQKPYNKHRINLRLFQGCPQLEISEGGRLWATWFGSNVQAERAPFHKDQFSVISTSADDGRTWKEVFVFDPSELLGGSASDPMLWKDPKGNIRFIGLRNIDFKGRDEFATSAWEFTMLDPEDEHTAWTAPAWKQEHLRHEAAHFFGQHDHALDGRLQACRQARPGENSLFERRYRRQAALCLCVARG